MTKTLTLLAVIFCLTFIRLSAQTTIALTVSGGVFVPSQVPVKADFTKPITIAAPAGITNYVVAKEKGSIQEPAKQGNGSYQVTVTKTTAKEFTVKLTGDGVRDFSLKITNQNQSTGKAISEGEAHAFFTANVAEYMSTFPYRYNRKGNTAYFFFDQKGTIIGPAPVNIDADDYIELYMAVPKASQADYTLEMTGDYSPSDLAIRPHEAIATGAAHGTGLIKQDEYTYIHRILGPFTSEKAVIKISGKNDDGENAVLNQIDVKINKLYNVGIGASFIGTDLANPNFDVMPLPGRNDNTIQKVNDGHRTIVTFNVIYYWKSTVDWITGKLKGSGHITRGRDILKEPTFWERLNPTFGVALSDKWKENFFFGGNFEFARGGSVSAGWHYGKVQSLIDTKFKFQEDVFTGTKDDIKTTNTWQWGGFIGITVDTRIFNALFSRN